MRHPAARPRAAARFVGLAAALVATVAGASACSSGPPDAEVQATPWPEADALFHRDPRWLGADAAYSVPLGGERVLWLFGDTFVATSDAHARSESEMVRNTIAISTGLDPTSAEITFHWRLDDEGTPASFFAEDGDEWHWPCGGQRLASGALVIFLARLRPTPGVGLGFGSAGWRIALIDDPDFAPADWSVRTIEPPPQAFDAIAGTAVTRDGEHVVALATRFEGIHRGHLVRFTEAALAAGDPSGAEWWAGARGWVRWDALEGEPAVVIDDAAPESSIHYDEREAAWIHVASYGFGATRVGVRRAPALTGPWSGAEIVLTPPESEREGAFVYAGKAHPELLSPDGALVITYATNSFDFWELFRPSGEALYWPRFARLPRPSR